MSAGVRETCFVCSKKKEEEEDAILLEIWNEENKELSC